MREMMKDETEDEDECQVGPTSQMIDDFAGISTNHGQSFSEGGGYDLRWDGLDASTLDNVYAPMGNG